MRLKPIVMGMFLLVSSCHPSFNPAYSALYKVQPEDTLFGIAYRNGLKLEQLVKANPGIDIRYIKPGAMINVPVETPTSIDVVVFNSDTIHDNLPVGGI